jgi:hypothetical protein
LCFQGNIIARCQRTAEKTALKYQKLENPLTRQFEFDGCKLTAVGPPERQTVDDSLDVKLLPLGLSSTVEPGNGPEAFLLERWRQGVPCEALVDNIILKDLSQMFISVVPFCFLL